MRADMREMMVRPERETSNPLSDVLADWNVYLERQSPKAAPISY
jgi:hypothetical protein